MLGIDDFDVAISRRKFDFLTCQQFAVTNQSINLCCFEQTGNTIRQLTYDTGTSLLHCSEVKLYA